MNNNRQPTAAKIVSEQAVETYDQHGHCMNRVSMAPDRVSSAVVSNNTLAINPTNGRALGERHSPVLRYTQ